MSVLTRLLFFPIFSATHYFLLPLVVALLATLGFLMPGTGKRVAHALTSVFTVLARKPITSALIAGTLAVGAGAVFFALHGYPTPFIHDEFSYLLAADTFAHGRLTNPPHPFWQHFESFYINQQPTYASMYPPGQGLVLAAGIALLGHPWFGVWASVIALCLVSGWALRGWFPPAWAFRGALMVATLVPFSYWMTSYWGGALAAIGGALVLGAWPRLRRLPTRRDAILFALGVVILANTRIYEGAVLTAAAGLALLWKTPSRPALLSPRILLPPALIFAAAAGWMMFYFRQVTGDPFLMPYVLNARTYLTHRLFPWQKDPQPHFYRHEVMARLYTSRGTKSAGLAAIIREILPAVEEFGGALLILPLCFFWPILRSRRIRGLLLATALVTVAVILSPWIFSHYLAPVMLGFVALILQALRCLSTLRFRGQRLGYFIAQTLFVVWLAAQWKTGLATLSVLEPPSWAADRARIQSELEQNGDTNLIFVRYQPNHDVDHEWVYNGADLFNAPVLWAREMTPQQDLALVQYRRPQAVWLLDADSGTLTPWTPSSR